MVVFLEIYNILSYMKEIYFIRHGQTNENSLGIRQGSEIDSELNELGQQQAKKTGKYLKKYRTKSINFDCIISSPMKRSIETAEIIGKELKLTKKIEVFDELIELGRGKMSGLTQDDKYRQNIEKEIEKKQKKIGDPIEYIYEFDMDKYLNDNFGVGIETKSNLSKRSKKIIDFIESKKCKKILVVSHAGIIMNTIKSIFNLNYTPIGNLSNGKNCWISYIQNDGGIYKLVSPPDSSHLGLKI
jgi:broad specificity phosphatase PhoE